MPRSLHAALLASVAVAFLARPSAAGDTIALPEEGVVVDAPAGFAPAPPAAGSSTVLRLVARGGEPEIKLQVLASSSSLTEERAFKLVRELMEGGESDVVDRTSGRFLRTEKAFEADGKKLRIRLYAALRNRRIYMFALTSPVEKFLEDVKALDAVVASSRFSPPVAKTPPPPAETAPVASPARGGEVAKVPPPPPRPKLEPELPPHPKPEPVPPPLDPVPPVTKKAEPEKKPDPVSPVAPVAPKQEPQKTDPEKTDPEKKPDPAPVAPVASPSVAPVASPAVARRISGENAISGKGALVSASSEYDPTIWSAAHLVDGTATRGWCSAPGAAAPHRFVVALGRTVELARVSFDNACRDFEDAAARDVLVEVSVSGPQDGWRPFLKASLVRGKNDQTFDATAAAAAKWIRLTVLTNHGHPTLTELMELRAFALAPAAAETEASDPGPALAIDRLRVSRTSNGEPASPAVFQGGERFFVNWKPRGLRPDPRGEVSFEVDLVIEGQDGKPLLARPRVVEHQGRAPRPPLSPFVAVHVDLPKGFPKGDYTARVVARDRVSGREAAARVAFAVAEGEPPRNGGR